MQCLAITVNNVAQHFAISGNIAGVNVDCRPIIGRETYCHINWQGWRIVVEPSAEPRVFDFQVTVTAEKDVDLIAGVHFVPDQD